MKFVLWFEPERVTPISRIAKEHPEWVLHAGPGDGLLNLGNPAARHLADRLPVEMFPGLGRRRLPQRLQHRSAPVLAGGRRARSAGDERNPLHRGLLPVLGRTSAPPAGLDDRQLRQRRPADRSGNHEPQLSALAERHARVVGMGANAWSTTDQIQTAGLSLYVPQHTEGVWVVHSVHLPQCGHDGRVALDGRARPRRVRRSWPGRRSPK